MAKPDYRSDEAKAYRRIYKTARWQATRLGQLRAHPLCKRCLSRGKIATATVCHHVDKDSKADPSTFFNGPFESLCAPCHDSGAQSEERLGFSNEIGVDGWPVDDRHPMNRG
jgi:5-methylcytosine-specific restriction protein A